MNNMNKESEKSTVDWELMMAHLHGRHWRGRNKACADGDCNHYRNKIGTCRRCGKPSRQ